MKRFLQVIMAALVLLLVASTVFAGGKKESSGSSGGASAQPAQTIANSPLAGKRIGVVHITLYDEWCKGVYDDFIKIGKEYGVAEMNIQNGDLNAETQQRQVEDFITQKYDIIFIDPVSPDGIKATLDKANAAGIPVIAFDSGTNWAPLISHIAWDHAETGRLTGSYVADYAKKNLGGKVRVGILAMLDAPHTAIRSVTFKEELEKGLGKANVSYVFEQDFGQTRESAANIVTNNIAKPIDIIWGAVDNAAFGARVALQANGVSNTKVVSAGAWGQEPFSTLAAKDPYYLMCIGIPPEGIVRTSMETAAKYFSGDRSFAKEQNIDLAVIDQNNIANYRQYY